MELRPIRTQADYKAALKKISYLLEAPVGSWETEVLNRKRPLSVEMIRRLNAGLGIPAEILILPY
jgi:antitoxin component HigA of HigAB toxin-antitoxin module